MDDWMKMEAFMYSVSIKAVEFQSTLFILHFFYCLFSTYNAHFHSKKAVEKNSVTSGNRE